MGSVSVGYIYRIPKISPGIKFQVFRKKAEEFMDIHELTSVFHIETSEAACLKSI